MRAINIIASVLCLLAALTTLVWQFKLSTIVPLILACLFILPIRWMRPKWFRAALMIPLGGLLLLLVDAYAFRHRIAVEARAWQPVWDIMEISDTFVSPSGQTTVYLLNSSWLDSSYSVCVSAGGLFPLSGHIVSPHGDTLRSELMAGWHGTLFMIGDQLISYAYSETEHRAYSYDEWSEGPVGLHDPPKTLEAFSAYVSSLKPRS